ncbi:MAG TPA: NUMOD3 domain-containing DNA-binding protein [Chitinophagaceae bacterium]|nr:NUMOD3 domain-containing DNA-binding protein [Chitinophagaceae bacterium]
MEKIIKRRKPHSEAAKLKMSLAKIGKSPPNKGIPHKPETIAKMKLTAKGEKSYRWMGDKVGNRGIHSFIERIVGRPKECTQCGETQKRIHLANVDHKYSRDPKDYIPLCPKCHRLYDIKNGLRPDTSYNLRPMKSKKQSSN